MSNRLRLLFPLLATWATLVGALAWCSATQAHPSEADMLAWVAAAKDWYGHRVVFPEIEEAISSGDFLSGLTLATRAIESYEKAEASQQTASMLAEAHRLKAISMQGLDPAVYAYPVILELQKSARLGSVSAIQSLIRQGPLLKAAKMDVVEIADIGADMADKESIDFLIENAATLKVPDNRRIFLQLLAAVIDRDPALVEKLELLQQSGTVDVGGLLAGMAFVGGLLPPDDAGRGSRDAVATLFSEVKFRERLKRAFGISLPSKPPEKDFTVSESLAMERFGADETGLASSLVTTVSEAGDGSQSLVVPRDRVGTALHVGDRVYVRCGALAHVATVFSVAPESDEIVFVDGLFEYWEPEKNFCISDFSQPHWKYGYHHTRLRLSEVAAMLVAVESTRGYVAPQQSERLTSSTAHEPGLAQLVAERNSAACEADSGSGGSIVARGFAYASARKMFTLPEMRLLSTRAFDDHVTSRMYVPMQMNARKMAIVAVRTGKMDCVGALSLFTRRSVLSSSKAAERFEADFLALYLRDAFGESAFRQVFDESVPGADEALRAAGRKILLAYVARQGFAHESIGGREIVVSHFEAENGVAWARIDVW